MLKKPTIQRGLLKQVMISLLGLLVMAGIGFPFVRNMVQRNNLNKEMAGLQNEIESYNKKNDNLKKAIDYLRSDQFVEEQARTNMGMKKPGEEVAVIKGGNNDELKIDEKDIFNIPGLEKSVPQKETSNIERWWNYFFAHKANI